MKCIISNKETKCLTKNKPIHPDYRKDLYDVRDKYYQEKLIECEEEMRNDNDSPNVDDETMSKLAKMLVTKVTVNEVIRLVEKKNKRILQMFGIEENE